MYTITSIPTGVLRSTLDYLHPLDLGTLLFCNRELSTVVVNQTHRWKTIGNTGNKRSRQSTIFRRFVKAANTHRLCYHCFQRKNGRSQYQVVCTECRDIDALHLMHERAWYNIERAFDSVRDDETFLGRIARATHDRRQTRNIGRLSKSHCGLNRGTSFPDYVCSLGRRILRENRNERCGHAIAGLRYLHTCVPVRKTLPDSSHCCRRC